MSALWINPIGHTLRKQGPPTPARGALARKSEPARAMIPHRLLAPPMTIEERIDSAKDKIKGKANQAAGEMRGDESQKRKGRAQELKGHLKDVKTDIKESLR